jgi:hypothetical protein
MAKKNEHDDTPRPGAELGILLGRLARRRPELKPPQLRGVHEDD